MSARRGLLHPERPIGHVIHLARRFFTSLSSQPPSTDDVVWVSSQLTEAEWGLWQRMDVRDRRHTLAVARNYIARRPSATRDEIAGALLHDIGKVAGNLGTFTRVVARIVGPRTARLREYHDHEAIGADMVAATGAGAVTVALVRGRATEAELVVTADLPTLIQTLRAADNAT